MMFRGLAAIQVDEKGRMAIPSRYRNSLQEEARGQLVVTIDTEQRCLLLYTLGEWEKIERKLVELPSLQASTRRVQRLLLGHATELEMDRQGRVLLPALLREYAGVDKEVMLVGQGNKFEVWSEREWANGREDWLKQTAKGEGLPPELEALSL